MFYHIISQAAAVTNSPVNARCKMDWRNRVARWRLAVTSADNSTTTLSDSQRLLLLGAQIAEVTIQELEKAGVLELFQTACGGTGEPSCGGETPEGD